jgi:V/A-type H+-transporting ATPase subunit B
VDAGSEQTGDPVTRVARTYHGAHAAAGPLVYVASARRAALGEWVTLRGPGQRFRGQVIDVGEDVTVVQVLEETHGLAPASVDVTLTGELAQMPVGRDLLGRVLTGGGEPRDGLPPPIGEALQPLWASPINPVRRLPPSDFIETGVSAIDGMNTLVRGQKLPVFSGPGLPALELAATIVESARAPRGEPFAVVFVAVGITERETRSFLDRFAASAALERSVLFLNQADDPTLERLLAPRAGLTCAEHLAFVHGMHVLVVMADITHYCEALREVAAAREEVPGRRGYPAYMYTDLASIFERAGVLAGKPGSVTQLPVLTMPDDDITHPIPDLTGYITEGQVVLSRELFRRGVFPPIDVLPSLSRLMNAGIGAGRTVPEHRRWADQLYAVYARGREARLMVAIVGEAGLTPGDRRALAFAESFERELVGQGGERRTLAETIERGWQLLDRVPREDLLKLTDAMIDARKTERAAAAHPRTGRRALRARPSGGGGAPRDRRAGRRRLPRPARGARGGRAGRAPVARTADPRDSCGDRAPGGVGSPRRRSRRPAFGRAKHGSTRQRRWPG